MANGADVRFAAMFPAPRQRWVDSMVLSVDEIRSIAAPTLLFHGREDKIIPLTTSLNLFHLIERRRRNPLAGGLLAEIQPGVHDAEVGLHRDGVDATVGRDVRQQLRPHPPSQVLQAVVEVGQVDEALLVGIEEGVVAEHHDDVRQGAGQRPVARQIDHGSAARTALDGRARSIRSGIHFGELT